MPERRQGVSAPIEVAREGEWLWACREGFEADLVSELPAARVAGPGLVASGDPGARLEAPTFGRQGFPVHACVPSTRAACAAVVTRLAGPAAFALHVWVPDTDSGNRLSAAANGLRAGILRDAPLLARRERAAHDGLDAAAPIVQICLADAERAFLGVLAAGRTPSP